MATRGAPRVMRGVTLAGCSTALAVAAHGVAGGGVPTVGLPIVATVLLAGVATALADRQRGPVAVLLVLGLAQLGMHLILKLGDEHHQHMVGPPIDPLLMTGLHIAATVATALLMTEADRALFAVVNGVRWLIDAVLAVFRPWPGYDGEQRIAGAPRPGFGVVESSLISVRPCRGPPVRLF